MEDIYSLEQRTRVITKAGKGNIRTGFERAWTESMTL